jgi:O-antigen ligase
LFEQDPIAGVGTANYNTEIVKRGFYSGESGAHNEFIRVAAEHGIIGIVTYWGFYVVLIYEILRRRKIQREYALYFLVVFCLITVHNGLKISIQPLILMLVVATPSYLVVKRKKNVQLIGKPA